MASSNPLGLQGKSLNTRVFIIVPGYYITQDPIKGNPLDSGYIGDMDSSSPDHQTSIEWEVE